MRFMDLETQGCRDLWINGFKDSGIQGFGELGIQGLRNSKGFQGITRDFRDLK